MKKYNYLEDVKADVQEYIKDNINLSEWDDRKMLQEYLENELMLCDDVTGNETGSYTQNEWQAEEYLAHNREELLEAVEAIAPETDYLVKTAQECDVLLRVYYLPQAIDEVLDTLWKDKIR